MEYTDEVYEMAMAMSDVAFRKAEELDVENPVLAITIAADLLIKTARKFAILRMLLGQKGVEELCNEAMRAMAEKTVKEAEDFLKGDSDE